MIAASDLWQATRIRRRSGRPGGQPDHMTGAALAVCPHRHLLDGKPGPAQAPREVRVGRRRPDRRAPRRASAPRRRRPAPAGRRARRWPCATGRRDRCRRRAGSRRSGRRADRRADVALDDSVTRGSSRLPAKISAIGPRAQATIAGTSSATVMRASGPSADSAARSVKPMPSPPISTAGAAGPASLAQRQRRQRLLRAAEPAVHQLVGAEHDREFRAAPLQPQARPPPGILALSISIPGDHRRTTCQNGGQGRSASRSGLPDVASRAITRPEPAENRRGAA